MREGRVRLEDAHLGEKAETKGMHKRLSASASATTQGAEKTQSPRLVEPRPPLYTHPNGDG